MSLSSHVNELRKKHEILSKQVETEVRQPAVDSLRLHELKRQKLRIKDEISRLAPE